MTKRKTPAAGKAARAGNRMPGKPRSSSPNHTAKQASPTYIVILGDGVTFFVTTRTQILEVLNA